MLVLKLTDLNVCRLCNKLSLRSPLAVDVASAVSPELQTRLLRLQAAIQSRPEGMVLARFDPHRLTRDTPPVKVRAPERVAAVRAGAYLIYPSCMPRNEDALEVRFLDARSRNSEGLATSRFEVFLDYGREETLDYVRLAIALGDASRLSPATLASVDPPQFWSCVLRIKAVIGEMDKHLAAASGDAGAGAGADADADASRTEALRATAKGWRSLLPGDSTRHKRLRYHPQLAVREDFWDLSSEAQHMRVARLGAIVALTQVLVVYPSNVIDSLTVAFDLDEEMRGTAVGDALDALLSAKAKGLSMEDVQEKVDAIFPERERMFPLPPNGTDGGGGQGADAGGAAAAAASAATAAAGGGAAENRLATPELKGNLRICSECGASELAQDMFRCCKGCKSAFYCGRVSLETTQAPTLFARDLETHRGNVRTPLYPSLRCPSLPSPPLLAHVGQDCQRKHWKGKGTKSAHKNVCQTTVGSPERNGLVSVVVFSVKHKPYEAWVHAGPSGRDFGTARESIGRDLLGVPSNQINVRAALRVENEEEVNPPVVLVVHKTARTGEANLRASTLVTPRGGPMFFGPGRAPIYGDAVVLKLDLRDRSLPYPYPMVDFRYAQFDKLYGLFTFMQFLPEQGMGTLFGNHEKGRRAQVLCWRQIEKMMAGEDVEDLGGRTEDEFEAMLAGTETGEEAARRERRENEKRSGKKQEKSGKKKKEKKEKRKKKEKRRKKKSGKKTK